MFFSNIFYAEHEVSISGSRTDGVSQAEDDDIDVGVDVAAAAA